MRSMKQVPRPSPATLRQEIDFLLSYSADVIASGSLAAQYDPKDVARSIDRLFGQHGRLTYRLPDTRYERSPVICGFTGTGKTYAAAKAACLQDVNPGKFAWAHGFKNEHRHPDFPNNYVGALRDLLLLGRRPLASTHSSVRDLLEDALIPYVLVFPAMRCKAEYLERLRQRGSSAESVRTLDENWETWIHELQEDTRAECHVILKPGQFMSDVVADIVEGKFTAPDPDDYTILAVPV